MRCRKIIALVLMTTLGSGAEPRPNAQSAPDFADLAPVDSELWRFVEANCLACHGESVRSGEIAFAPAQFVASPSNAALLQAVFEKVASGAMPPDDAQIRPNPMELEQFIDGLSRLLPEAQARETQPQLVRPARLTNEEYAASIRELLGVTVNTSDPGGLIPDDKFQGFARINSVQALSPVHAERYLATAEAILDEAYPLTVPQESQWSADAQDLLSGTDQAGARQTSDGEEEAVRVDLWPGQTVRTPGVDIAVPGDYRFRVLASGIRSADGRSPWLMITVETIDRVIYAGAWLADESAACELQFSAHLPVGRHVFAISNQVQGPQLLSTLRKSSERPFHSLAKGYLPWQLALVNEDKEPLHPCVLLDRLAIEGPVITADQQSQRERFLPSAGATLAEAKSGVKAFAELAFRRPLAASEQNRLDRFLEARGSDGAPPHEAAKEAMVAVLCSPEFLFLPNPREDQAEGPPGQQFALAARLSYLLWNAPPDNELVRIASAGQLDGDEVLRGQLRRMLNDPRSIRFARSFARQWLQLDRVGMFPPDKSLYPDYDAQLESSLQEEPMAYVQAVLAYNRSLGEFLDSDWTILDARLARHYGISGVISEEFHRVELAPDQHRGGLLTQAGILALTSDGARHRPVHRGVWIWETILGRTIPAPPPNIEPIATLAPSQQKLTVRGRLELHQDQPACAACHRKIDPLGFAFENYNALGQWRTVEEVRGGTGADPALDASGELADGRRFANADEFKRLLREDLDEFAHPFLRKLAIYALRRQLTPADELDIKQITRQLREQGYGMRDALEAIVMSGMFRGHAPQPK